MEPFVAPTGTVTPAAAGFDITTTKPKKPADEELLTIGRINRILEKLSPDQRARIMAYLVSRHAHPVTPAGA
jgi:hypothetical protein